MSKIQELESISKQIRKDIVSMVNKAGSGHPGGSLSATDVMTALYFDVANIDPSNPENPNRDRIIYSKAHVTPLIYSLLARKGFFDPKELDTFRKFKSNLQGHPHIKCLPGIESSGGSLGQGISLGIGHILGSRITGKDFRVYVLIGDGECQAGQIWESAMAAAHYQTDKLIAILDYNKYQEMGPISREMAVEPFVDKWHSFGWHTTEVDGHDIMAITNSLQELQTIKEKPSILIAHTIKGKGISFVEKDYTWHGRAIKDDEQYKQAEKEIQCS